MAVTTQDKIAGLYAAFFDRAPDKAGFDMWTGKLTTGTATLNDIAAGFAEHATFTSTYGSMSNQQFVEAIYQNVLGRAGDAAGIANQVAALNNGTYATRADFVAGFVESALTVDLTSASFASLSAEELSAAQARQDLLKNKVTVSQDFISKLGTATNVQNAANPESDLAYLASIKILSGVTENSATVTTAKAMNSALALDASSAMATLANLTEITDATVATVQADNANDLSNQIALTSALNLVNSVAGQTVYGDEDTLTTGDTINGDGNVDLDFSNAGTISGETINGADMLQIENTGVTTVRASDWTNLGGLTVNNSTGTLTVNDLQDAAVALTMTDYVDAAGVMTFNYDAQAVDGTEDVALTVSEVTSTIAMTGGNVEEVTLNIADVSGAISTLADLQVTGISTLEINGGTDTLDFTITGALDTTLDTIAAGDAVADLFLNVTAAGRDELTVTLGAGDDTLTTGNTLDEDTIVGGEGSDIVSAIFTDTGTRTPTMSGVETMNLTFNDSATVDFRNVNDLATINVAASTARISLENMDATVATINVAGNQANDHVFDYSSSTDATLTVNWDNDAGNDAAIGDLDFNDVKDLTVNFTGNDDVTADDLELDSADTELLTINVTGRGDVVIDDALNANMQDALTDLTISTSNYGTLNIDDIMDDAQSLERVTVSADTGDITLGLIGGTTVAAELDEMTVTASNDADATFDAIDATGATLSFIRVTADEDSFVTYGAVTAQDIDLIDVSVETDATVDFAGVVTATEVTEIDVDGDGTFNFDGANAIATIDEIDLSGMTANSVSDIIIANTTSAITILSGMGTHNFELGEGAATITLISADGADTFVQDGTVAGTQNFTNFQTTDSIDLDEAGIEGNNYLTGADSWIELSDVVAATSAVAAADAVSIASLAGATDLGTLAAGVNIARIATNYADVATMVDELETGGDFQLTLNDTGAAGFVANQSLFAVLWDDGANSYLSMVGSNTTYANNATFGVGALTGYNLITFTGIADCTTVTAAMLGTAII